MKKRQDLGLKSDEGVRVDYMKRLLTIEQVKASERQNLGEKSHEGGRSDEKTAEQFGISSNTLRKEISISDHKELLTPEDFADSDETKQHRTVTNLHQTVTQNISNSDLSTSKLRGWEYKS